MAELDECGHEYYSASLPEPLISHESVDHRRTKFNYREKAFSALWKKQNKEQNTVDVILGYSGTQACESEAAKIATMIQWLGTNCGWAFLHEVLETLGFRIAEQESVRSLHWHLSTYDFKERMPAEINNAKTASLAMLRLHEELHCKPLPPENIEERLLDDDSQTRKHAFEEYNRWKNVKANLAHLKEMYPTEYRNLIEEKPRHPWSNSDEESEDDG